MATGYNTGFYTATIFSFKYCAGARYACTWRQIALFNRYDGLVDNPRTAVSLESGSFILTCEQGLGKRIVDVGIRIRLCGRSL